MLLLNFFIRIISGSTLPINRWAYLEELKQLMRLGVVDDVAVLAETDIKNKENIMKRKSVYAQLKQQNAAKDEEIKNKAGTIETLERQLVQAGIKNKIMQGDVEVSKKKHDVKSTIEKEKLETQSMQRHLRKVLDTELKAASKNINKDLQE